MKVCSQCKQELSLEEFDAHKSGKDGRNPVCKQCRKANRQTKIGVVRMMYSSQKGKSKQRGYLPPTYSEEELSNWLATQPEFHEMFQGWVDSGYQIKFKPSCDRLNDLVSYTLDNLRVVTWHENSKKGYDSQVDGSNPKKNLAVDMLSMDGVFIRRFHSISEAGRYLNKRHGNIQNAIVHREVYAKNRHGKYYWITIKSAYGYKWRYSTVPNDIAEIRC